VHQHQIELGQHHHHVPTRTLGTVARGHNRARKMNAVAYDPPPRTVGSSGACMSIGLYVELRPFLRDHLAAYPTQRP
jgi:hypothetical protein